MQASQRGSQHLRLGRQLLCPGGHRAPGVGRERRHGAGWPGALQHRRGGRAVRGGAGEAGNPGGLNSSYRGFTRYSLTLPISRVGMSDNGDWDYMCQCYFAMFPS